MKKIGWSVCLVLIGGCASYSGVVETGQGSYLITQQAATGYPGLGNMKTDLIKEATSFCSKSNKQLKINDVKETQPPYILGNYPRVELSFSCEA
jgi:hypothetical protein